MFYFTNDNKIINLNHIVSIKKIENSNGRNYPYNEISYIYYMIKMIDGEEFEINDKEFHGNNGHHNNSLEYKLNNI